MFEDNTVAEIFTVLNGKSNVKIKFIEEVRAMIRAEQATWVSFGKAYSKDQLDRRHANVKPTLRFLNDEIPCLDNNRLNAVRDALNGVMVQTIVRVQNEAKMYPKILSKFDAVKAKAKAEGTFPAFLSMKEFRETWLGGVVNLIGDTASPTITLKEHLKNWMLLRLQDLKEIIVINNEWVLTDDTWLSRNVLGKIMAGFKKSKKQKCLLTTQEVLKLLQKDIGNELFQSLQSSLGDLLESIGACVKVNAIRSNESGSGSKPPAETAPTIFLFFPMIKLLVDMKTIQPMKLEGHPNLVVQQIMRKFMLCDCSFSTFPPGYFEHLFADIVSMEKCGNMNTAMDLKAYENALVLKCDGRRVEIIVKVEGDEFNVTVSTLATIEDYVADTSTFKSSAELRLSAIRGLIRKKKCPRIEEYCTHPTEENCTDLISTVVKDLHDETNRQMFYGITYLNNVELGTETLSSSVLRIITEAGLSRWPYSFVLTSEKIGQRCGDGKLSGSDNSFLSYLHSVASTQWQLLAPELSSSRVEDSTSAPEEPSVMWLYLVDQSTKKPITPTSSSDRYPIQIAEPGVFIKKWLYLILSSLSEMKSVHSIAKIAQLLDYPESELVEFFETVGLYAAKLSDFYNLNLPRSNYEKLSRKFLKAFQLCDLENFYIESNSEDIASLCNVHCREFRWMVDEESTRDDRQLDQKVGEGHGRMRNTSSELKLECYVWKKIYDSEPGEWTEEKKTIKFRDGQLIYYKNNTIKTSLKVIKCFSLARGAYKPTLPDKPQLYFQLVVEGYDQPRQPDLEGQDRQSEIVLGFEVEADFKTLNVVINSWIADSMTAPPVDPVMKALQDLQKGQQQIFKKVHEGQQDQHQTFKELHEGQQQIFKEVREGQQQIKSLHDVVNVGFASLHSDFEAYMDSDDSNELEHVVCCMDSLREALEQQAASTEDCKAAVRTILDWKASTSVSDNSISPALSDFMEKVTSQLTQLLSDADRQHIGSLERKNLLVQLTSKVNAVQDQIQSVRDDISSLHATFDKIGESVRDTLSNMSTQSNEDIKTLMEKLQAMDKEVQLISNADEKVKAWEDMKEQIVNLGLSTREINETISTNTRLLKKLVYNTHNVPTLMVLLPMPVKGGIKKVDPRNLFRDRAKLFFICAYTYKIVPCGPKKKGYTVTNLKTWVKKAIPVLKVGLLILQTALMAAGIPVPILGLAQEALCHEDKLSYLLHAEQLLQQPDDSLESSTDQLLGPLGDRFSESSANNVSNLKSAVTFAQSGVSAVETLQSNFDSLQSSTHSLIRDGGDMRSAYEAVRSFLDVEDHNLEHVGVVMKVTDSGKIGWVSPDVVEQFLINDGVPPEKK